MGSLFDNLSCTVIPTQFVGQVMNNKETQQLFRVSVVFDAAGAGEAPWGAGAGGPMGRSTAEDSWEQQSYL